MRNLLLVRYGEIFLKGQNRPLFMRALVKRIKYAVKDLGATVLLHDGRILVSDFDDLDECIRRVTKVFGVHSVCPAVEMPKDDFDALCNQAVAMMADLSGTFRVTARRSDKKKVVVLGAGPIRIGQGVEFDYSTVHAVQTIRRAGYEAIIINNNPETVSTDYDLSLIHI